VSGRTKGAKTPQRAPTPKEIGPTQGVPPPPNGKLRGGLGNRRHKSPGDVQAEMLREDRVGIVTRLKAQGYNYEQIRIAVEEALGIRVSVSTVREDFKKRQLEIANRSRAELQAMYDAALSANLDGHIDKARNGSATSAAVVERSVKTHAEIFGAPKKIDIGVGLSGSATILFADLEDALAAGDDNARDGDQPGAPGGAGGSGGPASGEEEPGEGSR
jgi:hypothetical protein